MGSTDVDTVRAALRKHWSLRSSTLWRADNPALGQCGVSALVAWEILGGQIAKTRYGDLWHFYNVIDGQRVDFTDSQFDAPIGYDDVPSNREEAFGDTNAAQYGYLSGAVRAELAHGPAPGRDKQAADSSGGTTP
ncbi:MAG: hypothetical protein AAFS07_17570 [Pseudomonadota bacterium]